MAIRWREDGTLICAAMSEPMEGDIYLDDNQHYRLVAYNKIVADENHNVNGLWHWTIGDE